MPFASQSFDLVVSTCVLAHVATPEEALEEIRRVARPGGQVVVAMPCDPGALNRLVKTLVTYPAMRRSGINDPKLNYARGHVNPIGGLLALSSHVFRNDQVCLGYTPFKIPSWNANLVVTLNVTIGH